MSEFSAYECEECREEFGYPVFVCRSCGSERLEEKVISGAGELYASTIIRVPGERHTADAPFEVGIVDVDGGTVRVTGLIQSLPMLDPGDSVVYVENRNGIHVFEEK